MPEPRHLNFGHLSGDLVQEFLVFLAETFARVLGCGIRIGEGKGHVFQHPIAGLTVIGIRGPA